MIINLLLLSEEDAEGPVLAAGRNHVCVVLRSKKVNCWGKNTRGQLGNNSKISSDQPLEVTGVDNAVAIYAGFDSSCAALADGSYKCWGDNSGGLFGLGHQDDLLTATTIDSLANNLGFAMHQGFLCQIRPEKTVQCAGSGFSGQLGDGLFSSSNEFVDVIGASDVVRLKAGRFHVCAIESQGSVKCWGQNNNGETGIGTTNPFRVGTATPVANINSATDLAIGDNHSCALLVDQTVQCWGRNSTGEIGSGSSESRVLIPETVSGIAAVEAIDAEFGTTCVILTDKTVKCWGRNEKGQLGNELTADFSSNIPVVAIGLNNTLELSLGESFSCSIHGQTRNGARLYCRGENRDGQLATTSFDRIALPTLTNHINKAVKKITVGIGHSCALYEDGTIDCWGRNSFGELGTGNLEHSTIPVNVPGISDAIDVDASNFNTCAVLSDGTVYCWGRDVLNRESSIVSPVVIPEISTAVQVAVGTSHICARLSDNGINTISCWGSNSSGQLGSVGGSTRTPRQVDNITAAEQIYSGANYSCALLENKTIQCWGNNTRGALGSPGGGSSTPRQVSNISNITDVATGSHHVCAVVDNDSVYCWGQGTDGQLGHGRNNGSGSPVQVSKNGQALTGAFLVGIGDSSSCAATEVNTDREVYCWGDNSEGQLGINNLAIEQSNTWLMVDALDSVVIDDFSHSGNSFCVLTKPSTIRCWGNNTFGAVGSGTRGFGLGLIEVDVPL